MFNHKLKVLVILVALTNTLLFVGCQDSETINAPVLNNTLTKFSLPVGATLESAELHIWVSSEDDQLVNIHRVTAPWSESTVTWGNFGSAYDNMNVINSFTADAIDWKVVDILSVVQGWVSGSYPDYGILLDQVNVHYPWTHYNSSEGTNKPFLKIGFTVNGGPIQYLDIPAFEDSYISEIAPTQNYGNALFLYTGWIANNPYTYDYEKQSLLKFDIEPTPNGGCTYTIGYWKTHSEFGPAPYDDTWALLPNGASTAFFLSGQSYYAVFNTAPAGNPYYQLAHQYMGAVLNQLHGADLSAVQTQFANATALFNTYTPAQVAAASNSIKNQFRALIQPLTDYNEGTIGPGHCE